MNKALLSVTIWLRKYQGRGGNYYTINNAASLIGTLQVVCFFLINDFVGRLGNHYFERGLIAMLIIGCSVFFWIILVFSLMAQLKRRKIHLSFRTYKKWLLFFLFLGITLIVVLLLKSLF